MNFFDHLAGQLARNRVRRREVLWLLGAGGASLGGDWDLEVQQGEVTLQALSASDWEGLLGVLRAEFITTARAKGLSEAERIEPIICRRNTASNCWPALSRFSSRRRRPMARLHRRHPRKTDPEIVQR